jgi:predicted nucleic acid-binding protein
VIVADTNLLLHLWGGRESAPLAEAVWRRDRLWVAPALWRSELRNALVTFVRARRLDAGQAATIIAEAELDMAGREFAVVSQHVITLALRSGCSAYDCEFVALAEELGIPLVTSDRQVLQAFPAVASAPETFLRD